jgi:hypothetical protein
VPPAISVALAALKRSRARQPAVTHGLLPSSFATDLGFFLGS